MSVFAVVPRLSGWCLMLVLCFACTGAMAQTQGLSPDAEISATPQVGSVTGFPIPRFVSLKASEGNARRGPSRSHRIDWVFQRRGMPMMVVAEHGHWRRVVDRDGAGGWMHYSLLSGVRTGIIEVDMLPLYNRPDPASQISAHAQAGVVARLRSCDPVWCLIEAGGHRGWVETSALWGLRPGETFD